MIAYQRTDEKISYQDEIHREANDPFLDASGMDPAGEVYDHDLSDEADDTELVDELARRGYSHEPSSQHHRMFGRTHNNSRLHPAA